MIDKKSILFLFAVSALLAACGGGSSDSAAPITDTGGALPAGNSPANSNSGTPPPAADTGNPPSAGNPPPAGAPADPGTPAPQPADQQLKGVVEMVANQILYIRRNRVIYLPVILNQLESDKGIVDVAAGSAAPPPLDIDAAGAGCTIANDGTCGVQPPAAAPAAPIAAFGIRLSKFVLPASPGQAVGNQTVVGRIAVDLAERKDSPGMGASGVPQVMRFIIDKVEIATNQNSEISSVKVQDGAQIHVYGRNAAGVEVRQDIPAPAGTVRILPMSAVPDNHGDTSSFFLLLDLETGFSQAGNRLAALEAIAGQFSMHVTLSSIQKLVRPAADAASPESPAVDKKDLVGQQIIVNDQPPVTGAGLVGNAWIRMYPAL